MKKVYILFFVGLFVGASVNAQVTFTQTTTDDFEKGFQENVLVGSGDIYLPEKGSDPGSWISTTNLPAALTGHQIVTYKNWAYLIGGYNGSNNTGNVYRASIQASGVGSWTGLNGLPAGIRKHAAVVGVSYIYVLGGIVNDAPSDQIFYAALNTDGSIGTWQTCDVTLPVGLWGHTARFMNGYIYVVGGADEISDTDASDAVYYAAVNPDGSLSEFTATASLPQPRNGHSMVAYDGKLFVIGGYDDSGVKQSTVYYSGTAANGTCTGWLSDQDLPVAVSNHASTCYNGMVTVICGDIGGAVPLTRKVYYADIDESPNLNWTLSDNELYYRRKDGQAFTANGQIIFAGGEELSGTPINVCRYALLTMDTEKVNKACFVSCPFYIGGEKNMDNMDYNITWSAGSNSYEILYRVAGNDGVWGNWISGGTSNPVNIGLSKAYIQYRVDFSATDDHQIIFHELNLNITGYTELEGNLNGITTLTQANSPYWATADIWLDAGALTIEPGVTIVFSPNTGLEIGQADLTCEGTETDPIVFTYYNDEETGQWKGVYFNGNSDAGTSTSSLAYTEIRNAGIGSWNANLYCSNTDQPSIDHCKFSNAVGNGIRLEGSSPTIEDSELTNNTENGLYLSNSNPALNNVEFGENGNAGVYYAGAGLNPVFTNCLIRENTYGIYAPTPDNSFVAPAAGTYILQDNVSDIAIGGGTVTADRNWAYFEQGYAVLGTVYVKTYGGHPRLTIQPGATLKFAAGAQMKVGGNSNEGGELYAEGTSDDLITFTALNGETGGWNGMVFADGSDSYSSSSSLRHCIVEKGADYNLYSDHTQEPFVLYSTFREAGNRGIYLNTSDIPIEETTLENNGEYGLYLISSGPSLVLVNMNGNGTAGVYYGDGSCNPTYFSCEISNSDFGFLYYTCNTSIDNSIVNGTITFNNMKAMIAIPGGTINASRTWGYLEFGYAILGTIEIYNNSVPCLTIAPGNTLKFEKDVKLHVAHPTNGNSWAMGRLVAEGTAEEPILFTALNDSTGGWNCLQFNDASDRDGITSSLKHCIIEKAVRDIECHWTSQPSVDSCIMREAALYGMSLDNSNLNVSNSTILNNGSGMACGGDYPAVFTDCEIRDNEELELNIFSPNSFPSFNDCTIKSSASGSAIDIYGGQLSKNKTWPYFDGVYNILGTIEIYNNSVPCLTIAPGNTLKFEKDVKLHVAHPTSGSSWAMGRLVAEGTAAEPILFTALNDSTGGWNCLQFNDASDREGITSSLKHCIIEKAVRDIECYWTSQPSVDSCIMREGAWGGMYLHNSNINVSNSTILNNRSGVVCDGDYPAVFTDCEIRDNEVLELNIFTPNSFPSFNNCTIKSSASGSAIDIYGGQLSKNKTWPYFDGVYNILGTIEINDYSVPCLTIAPGNTLKFEKDVKLHVAHPTSGSSWAMGRLVAEGTAEEPILFTALNDSAGGWNGLQFNDASDRDGIVSTLKNCSIEKAAENNIYCYSTTQPTFDSCVIAYSSGTGINLNYASPSINRTQIIENASYGIYINNNSTPVIGNAPDKSCDLFNNGTYDIYNNSGNNINARYNFWNTLDSLVVASRIYDKYDNAGKGEVYFSPFSYDGINPLDTLNRLSGNLMYANADSTSMPGTTLYIINEKNIVKDSTTTDGVGDYLFDGLSNSFCEFTIPDYYGGVNSTDALLILQHFAHVITLDGVRLMAADVNGSNTVNSTDALFVMKRFVHLIDEFPVGDWIIIPDIYPLLLYNDTIEADLYGLCYGDVDASFIAADKRDGNTIELVHGTEMAIDSWQKYRVFVTVKNSVTAGAVSLEFIYPDNAMDIHSVKLLPAGQEMISYSGSGTTRVAWADLTPVTLNKNDVMLELLIETKDISSIEGDISIELGNGSEMAGPSANILQDVVLNIPLLTVNHNEEDALQASANKLITSVYPNPFRNETTIGYRVPEEGNVNITIQKIDSDKKFVILNQRIAAGEYQTNFNAAGFPSGIYICTVSISNGLKVWFDNKKVIIRK